MTKWRSGIRVLFPCVVFLPRYALLARYMLSSCVRLYIYLLQAGIVSKRLDESSWFLAPIPHHVVRKFEYLQKSGYFPLALCARLRTWKILSRQVDRVVETRRRRRRRSSLLTTPIGQSTSRGCLLQVDQL